MKYYIADTHFGHENIISFSNRPFDCVEEMDEFMIDSWNDVVGNDDDIYIIGDFAYRSKNDYVYYLKRLKGRKHLIIGNHDRKMLSDEEAMSYFIDVERLTMAQDGNTSIVLCHYPILEWSGYYRKAYHIHGHIHNRKNEAFGVLRNKERALNAGVDIINFKPCSFQDLIQYNDEFKQRLR